MVGLIQKYYKNIINKKNGLYVLVITIVFLSLAISLRLLGFDPLIGLITLFTTSFKTSYGFWGTVTKFITLLLLSYAFTIPLKIKMFNIGSLGQMQIGGIVAMVVAFEVRGLPSSLTIILAILASVIAGSLYAYIAALLKNRSNINPVITTSMLMFISNYLVNYACSFEKYGELTSGFPMTFMIPKTANLKYMGPIPSWIFVVPTMIVLYYLVFQKTIIGYKIEATGNNPLAADAFGIDSKKLIVVTFLVAGAIAGLAGSIEVLGVQQRLVSGFARTSGSDFGTLGSLTSLVAGGGALGLPITAFFMSVLLVGADSMQRTIQVPSEIIYVLQSVLVLAIVTLREKTKRSSQ